MWIKSDGSKSTLNSFLNLIKFISFLILNYQFHATFATLIPAGEILYLLTYF